MQGKKYFASCFDQAEALFVPAAGIGHKCAINGRITGRLYFSNTLRFIFTAHKQMP
jgi:hypothetical protein